jgi:hypothetical protein
MPMVNWRRGIYRSPPRPSPLAREKYPSPARGGGWEGEVSARPRNASNTAFTMPGVNSLLARP